MAAAVSTGASAEESKADMEVKILAEEDRGTASFLKINEEYPGVRRVHTDPPIFVVDDFLTPEECGKLRDAGAPGLARSIVVDGKEGKTSAPTRTSSSCFLKKDEQRWLMEKVERLTNKPIPTHEPPQVARYQHGEFYRPHFDAFDLATGPGRECCLNGGNRVATVLCYLNDVPSGGGTYFPKINLRFRPKQGQAVVFFPCTTDEKLDPFALHTGEDAGEEKWVSQIWIRRGVFG